MRVLAVCTGNVARSAMLGYMLTTLGDGAGHDWKVRTAGTHVIENSTMSSRTRDALLSIEELGEHRFGAHRSHQVTRADVHWADVVLATEADHVRFTRALAPELASRVVQLRQFVDCAPPSTTLDDQLTFVSSLDLDPRLDVPDPAGGNQSDYEAVARSLWDLARRFAQLVDS